MSRVAAWMCLRSGNPAPLREVDTACAERDLDPRDRGLVRRLVGTEQRHRGTLRAIVKAFTRRQPSPDLTAHLHLGLVQLLYLERVPDHAAVSATVSAAGETSGPSKGPLINGVLRNVIRARREGRQDDPRRDLVDRDLSFEMPIFRDPYEHPHLWAEDAYSIPAALMKRWANKHGRTRALSLAETFLREPPLSFRAVRADRAAVKAELEAAGLVAREGEHEAVLVAESSDTGALTESRPFTEGRITIQGQAALQASELMQANEGERLLDLCAAPGGKTMRLLEAGAHVVASDVEPERLARIGEAAQRLQLSERLSLVAGDGTQAIDGASFDGVLVDAPCSNTGVLGARPGARWRFGPQTLRSLTELQERLLNEGAARVRSGGRLVWSTCSLEPEENEQLLRRFLEGNPEWSLEDEHLILPAASSDTGPYDGGFAARLRRA